MIIYKAYKYRIYPNKTQKEFLEHNFGACRFLWNALVANFDSYNTKQYIEYLSESSIKKANDWMNNVISYALQQKRIDFYETAKQYFNKNRKKRLGRPKFKKKGLSLDSFRIPCGNAIKPQHFNFERNTIKLPKMSSIKVKFHRSFNGEPRSVTVSKNNLNEYYISVLVKEEVQVLPKTCKDVGIDLGLNDLLILSDGTKFQNPKYFRENQAKLAKLQRRLSRKVKGSSRHKIMKLKVAKLHKKIARQREWYYHNISRYLVETYDTIILEDLNVSGMMKNRSLAKSIADASWSTLTRMISYKTVWYGKEIFQIGRFFASSKLCSNCNYKMEDMNLSIREWECPSCGSKHDRDHNAAINIYKEGMLKQHGLLSEELPEYSRGENVRPEWFLTRKADLVEVAN